MGRWPESIECQKFRSAFNDYQDVFARDTYALEQEGFNVNTHTVVLLEKGSYLGHVYVWQSPIQKDLCLMMGIRGRVENFF